MLFKLVFCVLLYVSSAISGASITFVRNNPDDADYRDGILITISTGIAMATSICLALS